MTREKYSAMLIIFFILAQKWYRVLKYESKSKNIRNTFLKNLYCSKNEIRNYEKTVISSVYNSKRNHSSSWKNIPKL